MTSPSLVVKRQPSKSKVLIDFHVDLYTVKSFDNMKKPSTKRCDIGTVLFANKKDHIYSEIMILHEQNTNSIISQVTA